MLSKLSLTSKFLLTLFAFVEENFTCSGLHIVHIGSMTLMPLKMTIQTFRRSKYCIAVAAMVVQGLLAIVIPITVTAVIFCGMSDLPHVFYVSSIFAKVEATVAAV
jgi:hypothetical protein